MILSPVPDRGPSLMVIEGGLTAIAVALAFCCPRLGSRYFARIESVFGRLSRKKGLSIAVVGASAFLLRLAILPLCPIPKPFVQDDFSFLLAANTFASGRLTNPTPAMWTHFESFQITMKPTYISMYFPAQGLILAAGKILTGHPWFGLLCATALMCAAICWMLQAWLPPTWALLGGIIVESCGSDFLAIGSIPTPAAARLPRSAGRLCWERFRDLGKRRVLATVCFCHLV